MGKRTKENTENLEEKIMTVHRIMQAPIIIVLSVDDRKGIVFLSVNNKQEFLRDDSTDEGDGALPEPSAPSLSGLSGLSLVNQQQRYIG